MTKTILGLVVIIQLSACAFQPSPEYWDALGNAKFDANGDESVVC